MNKPIPNSIASMAGEMTAWRRDFHEHPETSYEEVRRTADVALDVVMDMDEEWAVKIRRMKFETHNQEWLEVEINNLAASTAILAEIELSIRFAVRFRSRCLKISPVIK